MSRPSSCCDGADGLLLLREYLLDLALHDLAVFLGAHVDVADAPLAVNQHDLPQTVDDVGTERVALGIPMLGVFVIPERMSVGQAIKGLGIIAFASKLDEWRDRVIFLPL